MKRTRRVRASEQVIEVSNMTPEISRILQQFHSLYEQAMSYQSGSVDRYKYKLRLLDLVHKNKLPTFFWNKACSIGISEKWRKKRGLPSLPSKPKGPKLQTRYGDSVLRTATHKVARETK